MGGPDQQDELQAQIDDTHALLVDRGEFGSFLPHILLERAGLARMQGDDDAMARDLADARQRFSEIGVTGWDDYARSIEA